jgi:hypothetical protein
MTEARECKLCGEQFTPAPDHRGLVNVCLECGGTDIPRKKANLIAEGKSLYHFEIVDPRHHYHRKGAGVR